MSRKCLLNRKYIWCKWHHIPSKIGSILRRIRIGAEFPSKIGSILGVNGTIFLLNCTILYNYKIKKNKSPTGFEPATLGSRIRCSTNWAKETRRSVNLLFAKTINKLCACVDCWWFTWNRIGISDFPDGQLSFQLSNCLSSLSDFNPKISIK